MWVFIFIYFLFGLIYFVVTRGSACEAILFSFVWHETAVREMKNQRGVKHG